MISPKSLVPPRRGILAGLLTVLIAAFSLILIFAPTALAYDQAELDFLYLINNYRQSIGVQPLEMNEKLYNASENHSYEMGAYGFFGHTSPDGRSFADRIRAAGYTYNTAMGENLVAGYESAQAAFNAWRNSPGHDANMRNGSYCAVGVGRVYVPGSDYGWYWTTDFGGVCEGSSAPQPSQQPAPVGLASDEPEPAAAALSEPAVTTPSEPAPASTTASEPQPGDVIQSSEEPAAVMEQLQLAASSPVMNLIYVFNLLLQYLFLVTSG